MIRIAAASVPLLCSFVLSCLPVHAQSVQPVSSAPSPAPTGRIGFEIAAGPMCEVATAGDRESQRGLVAVPALGLRVASWFEYTLEGHLSRHVTPVSGNVFGIVPLGFRFHTRDRTQLHLSGGAGIAWSDLTGVRGVEQRRNYITQIGAGITKAGRRGAGLSLEARLFHLSNLHAAPPNLGMEVFTVLVGYRLPRWPPPRQVRPGLRKAAAFRRPTR